MLEKVALPARARRGGAGVSGGRAQPQRARRARDAPPTAWGGIVTAVPGCRVLCVYLRGERAGRPRPTCRARGERFRVALRVHRAEDAIGAACAARSTSRARSSRELAEMERQPLRWSVTTSWISRDRGRAPAPRHPRFDARVFAPSRARALIAATRRERAALGALGREGGGLQGGARSSTTRWSGRRCASWCARSTARRRAASSTPGARIRVARRARRRRTCTRVAA